MKLAREVAGAKALEMMDLETIVFIDDLKHMCKIFDDHTLPDLPEWLQDALDELWR